MKSVLIKHWVAALLSIAGLSFCFFLGFPFWHHNESLLWVPHLNCMNFIDVFYKSFLPPGYRPLGILIAWTTFKLTGGGIALQQIVNWIFACSSILLLLYYSKNKFTFSFLVFFGCVVYFAGYIYLFHLHGVFYGPMQFAVAYMITRERVSRLLLALVLASSFIHPFILPIAIMFIFGLLLEHPAQRGLLVKYIIGLAVLLLVFYVFLIPAKAFTLWEFTRGFVASYNMTEVNIYIKVFSFILSLALLLSIKSRQYIIAWAITLLVFFIYSLPIVLHFVMFTSIVQLFRKKYSKFFLLFILMIFPGLPGTGSPTYAVFIILASLYLLAEEIEIKKVELVLPAVGVVITALLLFIVIKFTDIHIVFLSKAFSPIMEEQEKTWQLKSVLDWREYTDKGKSWLVFSSSADVPVLANNNFNRENRPPVPQEVLNEYLQQDSLSAVKFIDFGGVWPAGKVIFTVPGKYNGSAYVYEK